MITDEEMAAFTAHMKMKRLEEDVALAKKVEAVAPGKQPLTYRTVVTFIQGFRAGKEATTPPRAETGPKMVLPGDGGCQIFWFGEEAGFRARCSTHNRWASECYNEKDSALAALTTERDALRSELERVRAALESIVRNADMDEDGFGVIAGLDYQEALRALAGKEGP